MHLFDCFVALVLFSFFVKESNPGHIGGRRVLSPLHHPCTPLRTSGWSTHAQNILTNSGCERLQKWTFPSTAHELEVARVRVLGADQKKSGLQGRDCASLREFLRLVVLKEEETVVILKTFVDA